jgi:predicted RNA binding protein YcfA (HicA-like mRNA interferase family)
MKVSQLRKQLEQAGCYMVRHGGCHDMYYSPITKQKFPVSRHMSDELPKGTASDIKKKAGI